MNHGAIDSPVVFLSLSYLSVHDHVFDTMKLSYRWIASLPSIYSFICWKPSHRGSAKIIHTAYIARSPRSQSAAMNSSAQTQTFSNRVIHTQTVISNVLKDADSWWERVCLHVPRMRSAVGSRIHGGSFRWIHGGSFRFPSFWNGATLRCRLLQLWYVTTPVHQITQANRMKWINGY